MNFTRSVDLFSLTPEVLSDTTIRIPVLPQGEYEHHRYGTLDWSPERLGEMVQHFDAQDLGFVPMLDFDHAPDNPLAPSAPAAGWFTGLEYEAGKGLFARVELTDLGQEAIRHKRYRYVSAAFANQYTTSSGKELANVILGAALTNRPWHDDSMPGLFSGASPTLPEPEALRLFAMDGALNHEEIRVAICRALDVETAMQRASSGLWGYCYVLEVYPDFFIYQEYSDAQPGERYYRRAYTLSGDSATLAEAREEVQQIWVVKARSLMAAARRATHTLKQPEQAGTSSPAPSGATENRMTLLERIRAKFGLAETATEEDAAAAIEAVAAPATEPDATNEPETPPVTPESAELSQKGGPDVAALAREVEDLKALARQARDDAENARTALARKGAEDLLQEFVGKGKITPAMAKAGPENGDPHLLAFALRDPAAFRAIYDAAPAVVDLTSRGRVTPQGEPGSTPETFQGYVGQLMAENRGLDYAAACSLAAEKKPELYERHRQSAGRAN